MNSIMKSIFEITIYSSIMIIIILAIKAIWKNKISIAVMSTLWILVLIRLLMPVTIESAFNVYNLFEEEPKSVSTEEIIDTSSTNYETIDFEKLTPVEVNPTISGEFSNNPIAYEDTKAPKETILSRFVKSIEKLDIYGIAFAIWACGATLIFLIDGIKIFRFSNKLNKCGQTKDAKILKILLKNKKKINLKRQVSIIISSHITTPVTVGIVSPKILIPKSLILNISEQKLSLIILHELSHVKRLDLLKNLIWFIAKTIHWFNPLVWIAYKNHMNDIELACDDRVLKNINKRESFEYSQSLLDVIRLSQIMINYPNAISFCSNIKTLEGRIENMIKPKKKLKSAGFMSIFIAVVMIVTCFTTACQPTPETEAVQSKNDGELEEAMMQTAAPETSQSTENEKQNIRIEDSVSNDTGTINVDIDAQVVTEGDEKITVARLESYNFEVEEMDSIVKKFFGGNVTYYDPLTNTKSVLEEHIIYLQRKLTLSDEELLAMYEDRGMTVSEIKAHINSVIEVYKEDAAKAPENAPVIEKFEIMEEGDGFTAAVEFGKGYMGYVDYTEPWFGITSFYCSAFKDEFNESKRGTRIYSDTIKTDFDTTSSEFAQAKQNAQSLIDEIGIDGVELGDVYISVCSATNSGETVATDKEFYVFCFERIVGERTIDYTFYDGAYSDDNDVVKAVPYEKIEVWTDGTEVVKFYWLNPHKVTEVVNENTAIQIDYMQALQLAINQIYAEYAYILDSGSSTNIEAEITGLEFEMVRMKEKDTDNYISVPAWKIYGEVRRKRSQEEIDKHADTNLGEWYSMTGAYGPNIVTVNALDGSIIDMEDGY